MNWSEFSIHTAGYYTCKEGSLNLYGCKQDLKAASNVINAFWKTADLDTSVLLDTAICTTIQT